MLARTSVGRVPVSVDLGDNGEPKGTSEVLFTPLLDRSVMLQFDLRVPLGLVIEEQDDGVLLVTGALPGYGSFGKIEVGDVVRAVTGYREIIVGGSMLSQMMSYTPVGKPELRRLLFRTDPGQASFSDVYDAIGSHRQAEGGNGVATIVVERAVNETTPVAPLDTRPLAVEPLKDVILADLKKAPADGDGLDQLSPLERARRLLGGDGEG